MIGNVEKRCIDLGHYIVETRSTVRQAATVFGISKSTVHNDVTKRLSVINPLLCSEVKEVLEENKAQRHIRGGLATKKKYIELNENR
ncbi:MAG: sporulation transcriptional regulator SpoIIID [Eubacterium sp.]|nr:sporulation transcriptional regulator SpoIIID [Eubacterium sp.]